MAATAAPAADLAQIVCDAEAIIDDLAQGMDGLAVAMSHDLRRDMAQLPARERARVVTHLHTRIQSADPTLHTRLAAVFGIDLPAAKDSDSRLTDTANGVRLANRYSGRLRYAKALGWLVWDGRRWKEDWDGEVDRLAKEVGRSIYSEAANELDDKARDDLARWAKASLSRPRQKAMIESSQSESLVIARPADFDTHPYLLNALNGVSDLRTGELHPHDRDLLLTRLAPVAYDPDARCDLFLEFIYRIFRDRGPLIDYVQRAIGYTLTGDTSEQVLFVCHGAGANGKTTLLELLRALLGDYGQQADFSAFLVRRSDGPRNDLARMAGARFVAAIESGEGRTFDERVVKQLTGGDTIAARFLFKEPFEFRPQAKFWLASNHKPAIQGTDHAIWRRIRLIPFDVTIPEAERDPHLLDKLRAELPGILAWAVRGCLAWQREGLAAPDEVLGATATYRAEQDTLAAFIEDRCVCQENAWVKAGELHAAYRAWGGQDGAREFGLRLKERGFQPDKGTGGARIWRGVGLVEPLT